MPPITGKTVYILGAGASQHTGIPLLRDFLFYARLLMESKTPLRHKDAYELVFSWIAALRGSAYYVELDLNNLEHIFSLAEMDKQIHPKDNNHIVKELRQVVSETLDNSCHLTYRGDLLPPDKLYGQFVESFGQMGKDKQSHFDNDSVITFNYDVMLDNAVDYHSMASEYCLTTDASDQSLRARIRLLKLHGSANWAECGACKNGKLQVIPPSPVFPSDVRFARTKEDVIPFRMAEILSRTPCQSCKQTNTLEPFFIAPTWSKKIEETPLTNVWSKAVEEIADAFQLVVVGYSMPKTDTFFQYLLTLGLADNPKLHRVIVVNTDDSEEFRERYAKVFSRSLIDRSALKFLCPMSFEGFVERYMKTIGTRTEWFVL